MKRQKWTVRKSPMGLWWAHEPGCKRSGDLVCLLFKECRSCGRFQAAFGYAEYKAVSDRVSPSRPASAIANNDPARAVGPSSTIPYRISVQ